MHRSVGVTIAVVMLAGCLSFNTSAQVSRKDDEVYKATALALKKQIWEKDLPNFKDYTVPDQYRGFSKIILASHNSLTVGDAIASKNAQTKVTEIHRNLIKLNDVAAVKEYSELSYTQLQKSSYTYYGYKSSEFLGVRIIKADGKIAEVSTDETIFTKDEKLERKAKLAIPDLQIGDLLDIYHVEEIKTDPENIRSIPYYYELYNDVPILHYSVHCSIGKKFATEYRCYNSAPDFILAKADDGATNLDLSLDSLLFIPSGTMWLAPMRQLPIIQMNIVKGDAVPYTPFTRRRPGEVIKDQDPEKIIRDAMIDLSFFKKQVLTTGVVFLRKKSDVTNTYYDELIKGGKSLQEDSAAAELYYMFRFDYMFGQLYVLNAERIINLAKRDHNTLIYNYLLSEYFKRHRMNAEVVMATSRNSVKMSELLDRRKLNTFCNVRGQHDILFGTSGIYDPAFYISSKLEGVPDAVAVDTKGDYDTYMATKFTSRRISAPESIPENNQHIESLTVMPDLKNNLAYVSRTTALTGHYKGDLQRHLLLIEDFYNYERRFFNDERNLVERIAEKKSQAEAAEMNAAFIAAREAQKEDFLKEAKSWFGLDIIEQDNLNIINPGVRHTAPAFEYGSTFKLNSVLKRAGNNYLLEVGKLSGDQPRVSDIYRNRAMDIYSSFPGIQKTAITIKVPEDYSIEGLDVLNKSVKNETGSFSASARLEGNIITVELEHIINSGYYALKDWKQLLSIFDAIADWSDSKLLLKHQSL